MSQLLRIFELLRIFRRTSSQFWRIQFDGFSRQPLCLFPIPIDSKCVLGEVEATQTLLLVRLHSGWRASHSNIVRRSIVRLISFPFDLPPCELCVSGTLTIHWLSPYAGVEACSRPSQMAFAETFFWHQRLQGNEILSCDSCKEGHCRASGTESNQQLYSLGNFF